MLTGDPHRTVPAGCVAGLAPDVWFLASAWLEPMPVRPADTYEQAAHRLRAPDDAASAPVGHRL